MKAYNCGVLNCGNEKCIHKLLKEICPCCGNQLVEVTTTGFKFCSSHESVCEYEEDTKQEIKMETNKEAEAVKAIKWTCAHCMYEQYTDDTLKPADVDHVRYDHIFCDCCGEDNTVILRELSCK